jgi:hypothetical protein
MQTLSPIEVRIVQSLIINEYGSQSVFLDQLNAAYFDVRHLTGVGYYVELEMFGSVARVDALNDELSEAYLTTFPAPCDLVGFTLFIRDGYLSSFEGYTFGDVQWPHAALASWVIVEAVPTTGVVADQGQELLEDLGEYVPYPPDLASYPPKMRNIWALHSLRGS